MAAKQLLFDEAARQAILRGVSKLSRAVTATLGLPVLRTSVDHGTAFDIAWKGLANPVSMKAAILAAADMLERSRRV